MSIEINKKKELRQIEQAAKLSTYTTKPSRRFYCTCYVDDDYEESTIPLNEIDSQIPSSNVITLVLLTLEPEDSLIIGNEELSTIPEKESDELIKSSVEDLIPILKVLEDIECKDSYDSNLDQSTFPVTHLSDSNEDEFFAPGDDIEFLLHRNEWKKILYDTSIDYLIFDSGGDINEIDAFLDIDISIDIEDSYHDSEGYILYLESLLSNDTILSLPPEVFHDHDPRTLSDINDLKIMVKVFDPGIHEKKNSPTYVSLTFEDRHYLSFTYVIQIFIPYFTYEVVSPFILSSGSEDTIFDPGIFAFHFYSLEPVAYKCPMEVCSSTIALDFKDSRSRGFLHRSLDLQSLACFFMGI
nr:hypothetical protein [Tanacetum cinerariifolium]